MMRQATKQKLADFGAARTSYLEACGRLRRHAPNWADVLQDVLQGQALNNRDLVHGKDRTVDGNALDLAVGECCIVGEAHGFESDYDCTDCFAHAINLFDAARNCCIVGSDDIMHPVGLVENTRLLRRITGNIDAFTDHFAAFHC